MKMEQNQTQSPMDQSLSERELAVLLKTGDQKAFSMILDMYEQKIFKMAFHFLYDADEAAEITQETFVRLYQNCSALNESIPVRYWLFKVASRLCIDQYRKAKKHVEIHPELFQYHSGQQSIIFNPEESAEKNQTFQIIIKFINTLSKRKKMVMVLKHFNGLKYEEIANIMNVSVGTVKSLHFRAIQSIRKKYEV